MIRLLDTKESILVVNVDILTNINFYQVMKYHKQHQADATLVISDKKTQRPLAIDGTLKFIGRFDPTMPVRLSKAYLFCGIQVIQPWIFSSFPDTVFYSIDAYIRALTLNAKIIGYLDNQSYWLDIGTIDDYEKAELDVKNGLLSA